MKAFSLFLGIGAFAFVAMAFQLGLFEGSRFADEDPKPQDDKAAKAAAPFPDSLVPVCHGRGVPQAAAYDPDTHKPHKLVFLKANGELHETWQEYLKPEWLAETVEETELVVAVGEEYKTLLSVHYYNRAPTVKRYKYELEVQVLEARTGKVLGRNRFVSIPRAIDRVEAWELTALGQPVSFTTVYNWVAGLTLAGVRGQDPTPVSSAPKQKP